MTKCGAKPEFSTQKQQSIPSVVMSNNLRRYLFKLGFSQYTGSIESVD